MANNSTGKIEVKGGHLIIDFPLGKGTPSASGKTLVLATTHGAVEVDGVYVNLTAWRKP